MPCHGINIQVTNCTVHGGWTAWSPWSACSQPCGVAIKTRKRTCGNPAPAHGGRVCVGPDTQELLCHSNPPCPTVSAPVQDGGWSGWGAWSECTARCGGGYRLRTRKCDNPPPQGGQECAGCGVEYEECNTHSCVESRKLSSWTAWLPVGNGTERRFRFSCKAPAADPNLIKITPYKEEERKCLADGVCTKPGRNQQDPEESWSEWGAWSPCTVECGGGVQYRTRSCDSVRQEDCVGPAKMSRPCNQHNCKGEWSCWTDWSQCSVPCGKGFRQRTRSCLAANNKQTEGTGCEGPSVSQEPCEMSPCQSSSGWESWGPWSDCTKDNTQTRYRKCRTSNPGPELCQGEDSDTRDCRELNYAEVRMADSLSTSSIFGLCLLAFLLGSAVSAAVAHYYTKRLRQALPPFLPTLYAC
ncbi:hypothetical protein WDU94_013512 [Cyamophila willieti]